MKEIEKFKKFVNLLKSDISLPFVKECINCIENEMILFHFGSVMDKPYVYETYYYRYQIQKKVTNSNVSGYDQLLKNINDFMGDSINVMTLTTELNSYIIFSDEVLSYLIGILKSPYSNIEKSMKIQKINLNAGHSSHSVKFYKGKLFT